MNKHQSFGFSLVELLIIIALIGILSAVVLLNILDTVPKGRDSKRITELHSIESSLEQYYTVEKEYLQVTGEVCTTVYCYDDSNRSSDFLGGLVTGNYARELLTDPLNDDTNKYIYVTPDATDPIRFGRYALISRLEILTEGENIYELYNTSGAAQGVYYYAIFSSYNYWVSDFDGGPTCTNSALLGGCLEKTW